MIRQTKLMNGFGQLLLDWPTSLVYGLWTHPEFKYLERFCFFIGHPRSGHSIVGALLDAHPSVTIAHELGLFRYVTVGFGGTQLFNLLQRNACRSAAAQRQSGEYKYSVPGQWQGLHRNLKIIGDKQGGGAVLRLKRRPHLLARLRRTVQLPIRCIHVLRHPLDNITTLHLKANHHCIGPQLEDAIDFFFDLCRGVTRIRADLKTDELIELRHEDFIADPRGHLQSLCGFLGVAPESGYLDACASIVRKTPNLSRTAIRWSADAVERVMQRCQDFPFLSSYVMENKL